MCRPSRQTFLRVGVAVATVAFLAAYVGLGTPVWAALRSAATAPSATAPPTATPSPEAAPVAATAALPSGMVKYYVVGPPVDGQPEYLFAIATRTLGDGNRAREIFNLNRGRTQPDGAALVDPAVLRPGWLLVLPADATGDGVRVGTLPVVDVSVSLTASPAVNPAVVPAVTTSDGPGTSVYVAGVAAAATSLLVLAVLRRRRTRGSPTHRSRTLRNRTHRSRTGRSQARYDPPATSQPIHQRTTRSAATHASGTERGPQWTDWDHTIRSEVGLPEVNGTGAVRPGAPVRGMPTRSAGHAWAGAEPRDHVVEVDHVLEVEVVAASGQDRATVSLVGARNQRSTPPWLWLDPDEPEPPRPTYVAVGGGSMGALCMNVIQAPDVLTVTGEAAGARRLAAALARQLIERGISVTVVGTVLGSRLPGSRIVRTIAEAEAATADPVAPQFVFCPPAPEDAATIRRLIERTSPHSIPVLVGDARRGRWSIHVHADASANPG